MVLPVRQAPKPRHGMAPARVGPRFAVPSVRPVHYWFQSFVQSNPPWLWTQTAYLYVLLAVPAKPRLDADWQFSSPLAPPLLLTRALGRMAGPGPRAQSVRTHPTRLQLNALAGCLIIIVRTSSLCRGMPMNVRRMPNSLPLRMPLRKNLAAIRSDVQAAAGAAGLLVAASALALAQTPPM